jgi:hypothetical protein
MFPPMPDYNQRMFAYLQAWRQFLEQWAAMMPGPPYPITPSVWPTVPMGGQFMPPAAPFMPPMPPVMAPTPTASAPPKPPGPPAPADYTQQLFGYLQAWRQYLEQMTGATPGSPQASTAQQPAPPNRPADDSDKGSNPPWPPSQLDVQPESPGGSQLSDQANQLIEIPPTSEYRSEYSRPGVDPTNPFGQVPDTAQLLNPPDYAFGYIDRAAPATFPAGSVTYTATPEASRSASEAPVELPVNSPFSAIMERVEPIASPEAGPKSLFNLGEAGQTPSP